jgi:hypothetical protein
VANPDPLNNQVFQLYNLNENFNQSEDIAVGPPGEGARRLRAMFLEEAKKYQVLPLNASVASRVAAPRPSLTAGLDELVYTRPMTGVPQGDAPYLLNTSYTVTADITVPEGGAEGMIVTSGGRFAGWGFYLLDGKPVFNWNMLNLEWVKWQGPDALTPGQHTVEFDFEYDGMGLGTIAYNSFAGVGKGGKGTLKVDGKVVAEKRMEKTIPIILQWDESLRHRLRHPHRHRRRRLPAAVPADGGAEQADHQDRPAAAVARGHRQAGGSHAAGGHGYPIAWPLAGCAQDAAARDCAIACASHDSRTKRN